ncbi:MAG: SDR family oxidoreductase [Novosphingobium sp.]|nr:SDR family oxidoreductase [Novosphingobium sp.]
MTDLTRRNLLAGTAAVASLAASETVMATSPALRDFTGVSVLITGTSSGFGNLTAKLLARRGAKVFATMRNMPRPEGFELLKIAADEKLDLHILELDVLSDGLVAGAIAEAERMNGGPLDILVNNAGINISGPVELQDMEATKLSFDTNVYGYLRTIRAVLPGMRSRRSGLIFNVSSQMGRVIMPGGGIYSASKFAVESMCEQLAYELVPHGIEVCIIEPGGFPTNIGNNRAKLTEALAERMEEKHSSGYPEMVKRMSGMRRGRTWPNAPDPNMVALAIAEVAAMPTGTRPLRRPVHPGPKPQLEINRISREVQLKWLGRMPYGEWAKAVLD